MATSAAENLHVQQKRVIGSPGFLVLVGMLLFVIGVIVLPQPGISCHGKSREARANAEMKNAELAIEKILKDTGAARVRDLFSDPNTLDGSTLQETLQRHTDAVHLLLSRGKNASLDLRPELRNRLGDLYIDFALDPWGENRYVFYLPYGEGNAANALDRRFIETYMTFFELGEGGPKKPWRQDAPIYIACKGKDGRLELLEPSVSGGIGDDMSNLREPTTARKIEALDKQTAGR